MVAWAGEQQQTTAGKIISRPKSDLDLDLDLDLLNPPGCGSSPSWLWWPFRPAVWVRQQSGSSLSEGATLGLAWVAVVGVVGAGGGGDGDIGVAHHRKAQP